MTGTAGSEAAPTIGERRARELAVRTSDRLARVPAGFVGWLEQLPSLDDSAVNAALTELSRHPGGQGLGATVVKAEQACDALVSQWQRAARAWERKGRPRHPVGDTQEAA